jgi:hypothetical protein
MIMQRRAFDRIPVDFKVRYFLGDTACNGTVTNLSENGMYIDTSIDFPFDSNFELVLPMKDKVMKLSAVIRRVVKSEGAYRGIGVELVEPPDNYLQFVNELRLAS